MNKSYILYGIAFILLVGIFLNDEPKVKTNYTKLYSENMFLEDNVRVESTKSKIFDCLYPIIQNILPDEWMPPEEKIFINPTGKFEIGGPDGDAGLTGRKIIVDTYGGACPHGGGAFSCLLYTSPSPRD